MLECDELHGKYGIPSDGSKAQLWLRLDACSLHGILVDKQEP
jgi:hypothetical protein